MRRTVTEVIDYDAVLSRLEDRGYVVISNVLSPHQVATMRSALDALFTTEREQPFNPGEGSICEEDAEFEAYLVENTLSVRLNWVV